VMTENLSDLFLALRTHWAASDLEPAGPAMPSDVAAFEQRHNVRLPSDLREYFLTLNGGILGHGGSVDNDFISFWRLDQVESIVDSGVDRGLFAFADWSIDAHVYAIALSSDAATPTPVYIVGGGRLIPAACSFADFVRGYLLGNEHVLYGKD
jgi:hypothetical protein